MFKSINEEKKTFSKKVVDHIRELIVSRQLLPGEQLPPERELAELMDVSRPTIREAFKILSAMGLIRIKHGQGVFVSDRTDSIDNLVSMLFFQTDTLHELFEVRKVLESQSAAWAAIRGSTEFLNQIYQHANEVYHRILQQDEVVDPDSQNQLLMEFDQQFHQMVAEAAGNEVLLRVMNSFMDLLRESRQQSMKIPGRVAQSLKEHIRIAEALLLRDEELARSRMFEHLSSVEQDLVIESEEAILPEEKEDS